MNEMLLGISFTAILTGLYKALLPDERNSSQIKLLISCFFILSVVRIVSSGFSGGVFDDITEILNDKSGYNDYSVEVRRLTEDEIAANMKNSVAELLAAENIFPEKIYIDINISDSGRISITEIKLVFDSASFGLYSKRAVELIGKNVGDKIKVSAYIDSRMNTGERSADQ